MHDFYPMMLDLRGRVVVVVGDSAAAIRKAESLSDCGAQVRVVAEHYADAELDGASLAIVVPSPGIPVEDVARDAARRGILINVVDRADLCSAITPSVLRRGPLTIAVSTGGVAPGLARRIRERLEGIFSPAWIPFLELSRAARQSLRAAGIGPGDRDAFFGALLESEALSLLDQGRTERALETTRRLVARAGGGSDHD